MVESTAKVANAFPLGLVSASPQPSYLDFSGATVIVDFYTKLLLAGHGYQVRLGSVTTPVTGDVLITTTAAEIAVDAAAGSVILPLSMSVDIEALGGTLPQVALKSVGTVSSSGTAFVPLPLLMNGDAATLTSARAAGAGGVTVTAEGVTTTRQHYAMTAAVAASTPEAINEDLRRIGVLNGAACLYLQVGSVATGSTYFANLDYCEVNSASLGI